jgi:hypothetical protein
MAASHGEEGRPRANISTAALGEVAADAAITACDAWDGEQRLKAHEHMVSNPSWAVEMFGPDADREGDADEAAR